MRPTLLFILVSTAVLHTGTQQIFFLFAISQYNWAEEEENIDYIYDIRLGLAALLHWYSTEI